MDIRHAECVLLSGWFLIMIIGAARASFLVPGRVNLRAHSRGLMGRRRSAQCSLLKTTPIVLATSLFRSLYSVTSPFYLIIDEYNCGLTLCIPTITTKPLTAPNSLFLANCRYPSLCGT